MCLAYLATAFWCFPQSIVTTEKEPPTDRSQSKRCVSLQPEYSKASGSLQLLNRDGTPITWVFDMWSFLTWEKGKFLWLCWNQKGLSVSSLSSTKRSLWFELCPILFSSAVQSLCHWALSQHSEIPILIQLTAALVLRIASSHSISVKIALFLTLYLTVTGSVACFCLDESPYTKSATQAKPPDGALSVRRQSIPGKTCFAFL